MAVNGKENSYKDFMSKAVLRFAPWDETKIKTILRESFINFEPEYSHQYTACLQKAWDKEAAESREKVRLDAERISKERAAKFAASPEEIERRRRLANEQYGPEICPTCGQSTRNELGWWSAIYKMPGWRCNGSLDHFLKWARENRRQHVG
jgi:hypothetical protein